MKKSSDIPESLTVVARAPFELFFDGSAQSVTAENEVGVFDILPGHADFFSMLTPGDIQIETSSGPQIIAITNGLISVRDNHVALFINM